MNAEILTIGAEILAGDILDTNTRDIALALRDLGFRVMRKSSLPDEIETIAAEVRELFGRTDVVLVTGGLGPTPDDLTREGVARGLGVGLTLREELLEPLRKRYLSYGNRSMPEVNLGQITLPDGAEAVPNPLGTAPGFRIERDGTVLFAVPGIPAEMKAMLEETILPWLRIHRPQPPIVSRTVNTLGIGESDLVTRFGELFRSLTEVEVGFYPRQPGVRIKLTGRGDDGPARVDRAVAAVQERMGTLVYGTDTARLPEVVGDLLVARGWRVATAESCTGGALAAYLASVSGASRYLDRGVVAYADAAKIDLLGVPEALIREHGAVSEPVARAMAEGLRGRSGVDVVLSTTGIAGPTGGSEEKPVGLVHSAIASPEGTEAWRDVHPGVRRLVIQRTVVTAVNRLRLRLGAAG